MTTDSPRPLFLRRRHSLLPGLAALLVIWAGFGIATPAFLSPENLVNLSLQSAPIGVIALGSVLTLLAGQIDLSIGSVAGLAASIVAVLSISAGWPLLVTVPLALITGLAIGVLYGLLVANVGVPGFVLTLAGLLVIAGLQWRVLGPAGSINLPLDSWLVRFSQSWFLPTWAALILVFLSGALLLAFRLAERRARLRADLPTRSPVEEIGAPALILVLGGGVVLYVAQARGVGASVLLFLVLVVIVDIGVRHTRWGRGMRATGSDIRTARLAGVPVKRITLIAFAACSTFAALGGVLAAGRLAAANQDTGGSELFLLAIAAALIGGTSMYGGRGSAWAAVIGVLVIQSIANGLTLLDLDTATRNITTGAVLAIAVTVDTFLRRNRVRALAH